MGKEIKESHFTSLIPERHPPRKLSISQNEILAKSDLYIFFYCFRTANYIHQ